MGSRSSRPRPHALAVVIALVHAFVLVHAFAIVLALARWRARSRAGNPGHQAIGSWAWVPLGTLGTQAATGNLGHQRQSYRSEVRTPPQ